MRRDQELRMPILRETIALAAICVADLVWTVHVLLNGTAVEANPVLSYYLHHGGMIAFIAAKSLLVIGPLVGLEWLRRRQPTFIRLLLRAGIALYLLMYVAGVMHVNAPAVANTEPYQVAFQQP